MCVPSCWTRVRSLKRKWSMTDIEDHCNPNLIQSDLHVKMIGSFKSKGPNWTSFFVSWWRVGLSTRPAKEHVLELFQTLDELIFSFHYHRLCTSRERDRNVIYVNAPTHNLHQSRIFSRIFSRILIRLTALMKMSNGSLTTKKNTTKEKQHFWIF